MSLPLRRCVIFKTCVQTMDNSTTKNVLSYVMNIELPHNTYFNYMNYFCRINRCNTDAEVDQLIAMVNVDGSLHVTVNHT